MYFTVNVNASPEPIIMNVYRAHSINVLVTCYVLFICNLILPVQQCAWVFICMCPVRSSHHFTDGDAEEVTNLPKATLLINEVSGNKI